MKNTMKLLLLTLLSISTFAQGAEDKEPSLGYTLKIDGQSTRILIGDQQTVKGSFTDPKIQLTADKERLFEYADLEFKYPAYFAFEAEIRSDDYKNWTLSGNDVVIMVFLISGNFTPEAYVKGIRGQFGENLKEENIEKKWGERTYKGKRVFFNIGGQNLFQDALRIPTKGKKSLLIVVQDSPEEEKISNKEADWANGLLQTTFKRK